MRFGRLFLAPMALIVAAAFVTLGVGLFWLTELQNDMEATREVQLTRTVVSGRIERMRTFVREYARWDDAVVNAIVDFDVAWMDENIGYAYKLNRAEYVLVITEAGAGPYSLVDGRHRRVDPAAALGPGLARAVRELARARGGARDAALVGFTVTERGPALFGISRVRPSTAAVKEPAGPNHYLVAAQLLDAQRLEELRRDTLGPPMHWTAERDADAVQLPLAGHHGYPAGALEWASAEPGTKLRHRLFPLLGAVGVLICLLATTVLLGARRAVAELSLSETRATRLANHDVLTGLPNRRAFTDHLLRLSREDRRYTLLYLDLDGFKDVNDAFGHATGDALLCRTAERLVRLLPRALLARLGGDEFALVIEGRHDEAELEAIAASIVAAVREPYDLRAEPIVVGTSVGVATDDGTDFEDVVRRADIAMYAAKARGRDNWCLFDPGLDDGRIERKLLEFELRRAIDAGELSVVFQPIIRANDEQIVSVEALARWDHPTRGSISPDIFIPIAEESGLIVDLGRDILRKACHAARDWPFALAVNLSPAQFWDRSLVDDVVATLKECRFPPERLEFEITETYLLRRPEAAAEVISQLRARGIRMALDDFGSGYASIGYLQRFELDLVKLDRSFVERVAIDKGAAEIALAIIALGNAMRLPILAEGVETPEQAALLATAGCAYMQGWHYGRPVPAATIDAMQGIVRPAPVCEPPAISDRLAATASAS